MLTLANTLKENMEQTNYYKLDHYLDIIQNYNDTDWKDYEVYNRDHYNKTLAVSNEYFNIYVVTWKPNQGTLKHGHLKNGCLLKILKGTITETRYLNNGDCECMNYIEGECTYIDDDIGLHKMVNRSGRNVVSIHIYPPS